VELRLIAETVYVTLRYWKVLMDGNTVGAVEAQSTRKAEVNDVLCNALSERAICYLPQRDGILLTEAVREGGGRERLARFVFESDISAIRSSNLVVAVLDGSEIDAGVAVEIGISWALGKRIFGLRTDARQPISGGLNPMVEGSCYKIAYALQDLIRFVFEEITPH
jgi:hypothetical protein